MYRFLLSPRWIAGVLGILLAIAGMIWAGTWQLDRMHTRQAANAAITAAADAEPVPAGELIPPDAATAPEQSAEWRVVTLTGQYSPDETIVVRQRTFDEGMAFEVVVPFETEDGVTYLVDRGYVLATARADVLPAIPAPPAGEVELTGRVRLPFPSSENATRVEVIDGTRAVRALDPVLLSDELGIDLAGGFVTATDEVDSSGARVDDIARIPLPPLEEGPHLAYAVQWFLFATIAIVGLGYLIRREGQYYLLADEDLDDDLDDHGLDDDDNDNDIANDNDNDNDNDDHNEPTEGAVRGREPAVVPAEPGSAR